MTEHLGPIIRFVAEVNLGSVERPEWSRVTYYGPKDTLDAAIASADRHPLYGKGVRLPCRIVKESITEEVVHRVWP